MGGFVVTMVYGFSRSTANLDVLEIAPAAAGRSMLELGMQGGPLHKKYKVYLDRVGVAKVPENYEDRLTEIFPRALRYIRLLALDPYDLALSKLERNIQRDRDDVKHLAKTVPFDLEVLKERYQKELRWYMRKAARGSSAEERKTICRFTTGLMSRRRSSQTSATGPYVTMPRAFSWRRNCLVLPSRIATATRFRSAM
jgi:hypothetical protein